MSDDMVKKSVDITQEDEEWLEENPINFSKWVRRRIAKQRAKSVRDSVRQQLYEDVQKVIEIGKHLEEEWSEFEEEIQEEYDAEIVDKETHRFAYKIDGDIYYCDWAGKEPQGPDGRAEKKAKEFASKYGEKRQSLVSEYNDRVKEETHFNQGEVQEASYQFYGKGTLRKFNLVTTYFPTSQTEIDVLFDSTIRLRWEDIEEQIEE